MESFTVYMHICPNSKRYIGITSYKVQRRWRKNGTGYKGQVFHNAIQKYGWENIEHVIVAENISQEKACELEIDLIKKYNTTNNKYGYNISTGGNVSGLGVKLTKEQVEVITNRFSVPIYQFSFCGDYIKRWKSASEASRALDIDSSLISSTCRDEVNFAGDYFWTRVDDSVFSKNPIGSKEFKNYVKKHIYIGKKLDVNGVCINQYTLDGVFIKEWKSAHEVTRELNINNSSIIGTCKNNGINHSAGGFIWRYKGSVIPAILKYKKTGNRISQYSVDGKFIKTWDSASDAKRFLRIDDSSIIGVCKNNGVNHTAGGFKWAYAHDNQN